MPTLRVHRQDPGKHTPSQTSTGQLTYQCPWVSWENEPAPILAPSGSGRSDCRLAVTSASGRNDTRRKAHGGRSEKSKARHPSGRGGGRLLLKLMQEWRSQRD